MTTSWRHVNVQLGCQVILFTNDLDVLGSFGEAKEWLRESLQRIVHRTVINVLKRYHEESIFECVHTCLKVAISLDRLIKVCHHIGIGGNYGRISFAKCDSVAVFDVDLLCHGRISHSLTHLRQEYVQVGLVLHLPMRGHRNIRREKSIRLWVCDNKSSKKLSNTISKEWFAWWGFGKHYTVLPRPLCNDQFLGDQKMVRAPMCQHQNRKKITSHKLGWINRTYLWIIHLREVLLQFSDCRLQSCLNTTRCQVRSKIGWSNRQTVLFVMNIEHILDSFDLLAWEMLRSWRILNKLHKILSMVKVLLLKHSLVMELWCSLDV